MKPCAAFSKSSFSLKLRYRCIARLAAFVALLAGLGDVPCCCAEALPAPSTDARVMINVVLCFIVFLCPDFCPDVFCVSCVCLVRWFGLMLPPQRDCEEVALGIGLHNLRIVPPRERPCARLPRGHPHARASRGPRR